MLMTQHSITYQLMQILCWIVIIVIGFFIAYGLISSMASNSLCKSECINEDALTYDVVAGGGFDSSSDICICYYKNSIKTFRLGG